MAIVRLYLMWMRRFPTGVIARLKLVFVRFLRRHAAPRLNSFLSTPCLPDFFAARILHGITSRSSPIAAGGP
jgi:hypothetical protein